MTLELTEQQRQVVEGQAGRPVEVVDPGSQRSYMLIDREQFEKVRPFLEEGQPSATFTENSVQVSAIMLRSQQAFWRDLPELLKQKRFRKRWVCYHGDERIGVDKNDAELVRLCLKRGLERGQFYLGRIEEDPTPPWEPTEMEQSLFEAED
jgi:hypothetical protein